MGIIVALYRYPVKGFTPESRESLTIVDGRIAGDRVLGFRFADTPEPDEAWSRKHGMLALVHTPGITRLRLSYDEAAQRIKISLDGELLVEDGLDAAGRGRICDAVTSFAKDLPESGLRGHPERLPLRLVGDGRTPRYQDRPDGYVTIHGGASVQALGKVLEDPNLSELRFALTCRLTVWARSRSKAGSARRSALARCGSMRWYPSAAALRRMLIRRRGSVTGRS
jgi:hypothetical protein